MMLLNSENRYGLIAESFHWLMAILLIVLVILGLYMTRIPMSLLKLKLYGWHKELGILVLMLVILRLIWRLFNVKPKLNHLPKWEQISSQIVHWLFYFLMLALPISGWLLTSASGLPVSFFGLFILPDLVSPSEDLRFTFTLIHNWLAYGLIAIFCLHTSAALKHHFIDKDNILRRML